MLALWNEPIKNENQIIVRSKQPIKIEKPFQGLLTFSHSAGEKNILRSVLLLFFSVFISSMPSKVILIVIEIMFLGINMFWALLRVILARAAKMSLSRTQNIFYMPANINSIVILVICTNTPLVMIHKPREMMIRKRLFQEVCLKKISREVQYISCFEISSYSNWNDLYF